MKFFFFSLYTFLAPKGNTNFSSFQFCEEFKEKCPICVPCGLRLAEKTQIAIVRHFGLQILEHVVK